MVLSNEYANARKMGLVLFSSVFKPFVCCPDFFELEEHSSLNFSLSTSILASIVQQVIFYLHKLKEG